MTRSTTLLRTLAIVAVVSLWTPAEAKAPPGASLVSIQEYFSTLADRFVPEEARKVDAVIQWRLAGEGGGDWFAVIENGTVDVIRGTHRSPSLTISASAADWLGVLRGELDGRKSFLTGRVDIDGSIRLALRMKSMFPLS